MSVGRKKGVRVTGKYVAAPTDWDSGGGGGPSIIHPYTSPPRPPDTPTTISISPPSQRPYVMVPERDYPVVEEEPPVVR